MQQEQLENSFSTPDQLPRYVAISAAALAFANVVKRPETIYFLGFTLYCTRKRKGNFRIGMRTEKSRLRRALMRLREQMMRLMRHSLPEQVHHLNQMLRGHDAYYGIAGNLRSLLKVHRAVERYWRKILSSRGAGTARSLGSNSNGSSRSSRCLNRSSTSLTRSYRPSPNCESTSDEPSAGNPHAGFCGSPGWVTASGHPVAVSNGRPYRDSYVLYCLQMSRYR
jgi:hypothetical protein